MKYKIQLALVCFSLGWSHATAQLHVVQETYVYDQAGRLSAVQYDNEAYINYTYDASGNMLTVESHGAPTATKDPGKTASMLLSASPNPFDDRFQLTFTLTAPMRSNITLHNAMGMYLQTLASGNFEEGNHVIEWTDQNAGIDRLASGVYTIRLSTHAGTAVAKTVKMDR